MSEQQSSQVFVPENSETIIVDLDCGTGGNTDVGLDICAVIDKDSNTFGEDTEKPTEITLTLGDTLTNEINSTQGDKLEVGNVMTGDDGDGMYFIRVSDSDKPGDTDGLYFSGDVGAGESFTAIGNDGKFGSETFVHIFSSDGGTLLQTINFHTSCSAPLVIGDQYGSVSLAGAAVEGKDTGTIYQIGSTEAAGDEGVTYSIKEGPGSELFQVNEDGEVSFIDAPDFENPQGINGTNNYEVVVLCETANGVEEKIIEICVEDECIKITENSETIIVDLDCGTGGNTDVGLDICAVIDKDSNTFGEDTEKPTEITLTLGDTLTNEINSTQGDKLEVGNVMTGDDGDGMYFIRVSDSDKPGDTDGLYFSGDVGAGESFTAIGNDGKFGSETFVHIFSSDGGTLLQTINFHTSCSAPLVIGDQYGSVSLAGAAVEGKDTGTIYQIGSTEAAGDEGVTYSIKEGPGSELFQVNEDGEVSFIDAPDFENPQGINGTNNYEVVVLCETANGVEEKIIEICVEDECIKITENSETIIVDLDCGTGGNTDVGLDICAAIHADMNTFGEDTEKPSEITLTLGDTLTNEINSTQGDKLEVGNVMTGDDGDGSYFIRVSDSDKPGDTDGLYFSGDVGAGESFTAIGNDGKFGSETFVHIFSSDGGTLLQTINFHTSCSAPLVIGDQYGSVSLAGAAVEGKDTGTIYQIGSTEAAGDEGVTYSIKEGPGSELFQVNEDGEVSFIDAPDFENPQGINGTNNYEVVVLCETANGVEEKIIEICVEDELDKVCVDENTSPQPIVNVDLTVSCPVPGANDGEDICAVLKEENNSFGEDTEKPTEITLTLGDTLTNEINSTQGDKLEVGNVMTGDDGDGSYFIRVSDSDKPGDTDGLYFSGDVGAGESFTAIGNDGKFGSETFVHIFSSDGGTLLQTINFHTSCSAPLVIGDQYGSVSLAGAAVEGKDTGTIYQLTGTSIEELGEGDITYSLSGDDSALFNIDAETGEITFKAAPDFENPEDVGKDNLYNLTVRAEAKTDPTCFTEKPIEICVEDVPEFGSLSGRYFCDTNDNDLDDGQTVDPGEVGVVVTAFDAAGNEVGSTVTGEDGTYAFNGLPAGIYSVVFTDPGAVLAGKTLVTPNVGADDTIDSDAVGDITSSTIAGIVVEADADTPDNDAGVEDPGTAAIAGRVFCDDNKNNVDDNNGDEPGVGGVTVVLLNADGTPTGLTTFTANDGSYSFTGLAAGDYIVDFPTVVDGKVLVEEGAANDGSESDANTTTGETGVISLAIGETSTDNDAGVADPGTASLGNLVFLDNDGNGVFNAGDDVVEGVLVELVDENGDVIGNDTTDAAGNYLFDGLDAGIYSVRFTAPDGLEFTTQSGAAADAVNNDSDADLTTGETGQVELSIGEAERDVDAGLIVTDTGDAAIVGRVFCDDNKNNVDDNNGDEPGVGGVTVVLLNADGTPTGLTTFTANDGSYSFTGLAAGDYIVDFPTVVDGKVLVEEGAANDGSESDANTTTGETGVISLAIGEISTDNDAGVADPGTASLGNLVFLDNDGNGVFNAGDDVVEGVLVELVDENGDVIGNDTTDAAGNYLFDGLDAGIYSVRFTAPDGLEFTTQSGAAADAVNNDSDADLTTGETGQVELSIGEAERDVDAGLIVTDTGDAAIVGRVFCDDNKNNVDDNNGDEPGVGGVTVVLLNADGTPTGLTTFTANDGSYSFTGLAAGDYIVDFPTVVDGKVLVEEGAANDGSESDANTTTGETGVISLAIGEISTDNDAGVADPGTASLGNLVFLDNDGNGVFNAGDDVVEGVLVELVDENGDVIGNDTTDAAGNYLFDGLDAGIYSVRFTAPDGLEFTTQSGAAADAVNNDSDADLTTGETGQVELSIGEAERDVDAGLIVTDTGDAAIVGRVFCDDNKNNVDDNNGDEPGVGGVTVVLLNADGTPTGLTTFTANDGSYSFTGLAAGDYIVDFPTVVDGKVLVEEGAANDGSESDANTTTGETGVISLAIGETSTDNDAGVADPGTASLGNLVFLDNDGNGVFNAGDDVVEGVLVELVDENGDVIGNDTTDAAGNYLFDGLDAGIYSVRFTAPDGLEFTTQSGAAADAVNNDSDADLATGETGQVELSIGEAERDVDAGLIVTDTGDASVGDFVFFDANGNGLQDLGETGVSGVEVILEGAGEDGIFGNGNDTTATTTTDADGKYLFDNLKSGDYKITFNQATTGGLIFTALGAAAADAAGNDSDADPTTGMTDIFNLGIGEAERDIDAGLVDPGTASVGDTVWFDDNKDGILNNGEAGADGVTVMLLSDLDGDGQIDDVVATAVTENGGQYLFDGLDAGEYAVMFGAVDTFEFTTPSTVAADAVNNDSDADVDGKTGSFTLSIGEAERNIDAGLVAVNENPTPQDDIAKTCADEVLTVNVLANDTDPDGDDIALVITSVDGQAILEGVTISTDAGTLVTLTGGELVIDGEAAYAALDIGQSVLENISYTVTDSDGGTADANVAVTFCGDANTVQSFNGSLPNGLVQYQVQASNIDFPVEEYAFNVKITASGDDRFDGMIFDQAYCLSVFDLAGASEDFATAPTNTADMFGAAEATPALFDGDQISVANGNSAFDNLDLVNWILNQDYENDGTGSVNGDFSGWEVQLAIWELTDNREADFFTEFDPGYGDIEDVDFIVNQAIANGEGFEAGVGDIVGVVLDPNPSTAANAQPFIIAMNFEDYDCIC